MSFWLTTVNFVPHPFSYGAMMYPEMMVSARMVFGFSGHLASSTTDLKCMVIVPGDGKSFFTFLC
jgi:hypothetical protein